MNVGWKRAALGGIAFLAVGCGADFEDLRPAQPDASILILDAELGDADVIAPEEDGGAVSPNPDPSDSELLVSSGIWSGRSDYRATGSVEIVRLATGQSELRLSEDFSVSSVPGPVVVLSFRDQLGSSLDPSQGDVELGVFQRGVRTYPIPDQTNDRLFAWIYCRPFRIEVARASLESVP